MTSLTFYGGVGEIGGNKILLGEDETKIFFDFGMSFSLANKYFAEFLQPRKCNGVKDFIEFGLLPDIYGLYREDYEKHVGRKTIAEPFADAVFLTHAHMDHSSYIHHLRQDVPVYGSTATKAILEVLDVTGSSGFTEFINLRRSFELVPMTRGDGFKKLQGEEAKVPRDVRALDKKTDIDNISVEPVPVNHSLPGATAYIIHTSKGNIVYTGDFRFHGYGGELTQNFVKKAADIEPDVLITEGTRINEHKGGTEKDVMEKVSTVISSTKELVIVNFPVRDTDRMKSFYDAAKQNDRKLVVNLKQAYLLKLLADTGVDVPSIDDKNIRIYMPRKTWGLITRKNDYPENVIEQDYDGWEREFLRHKNAVTCEDIRGNQGEYVFRCDFFELKNLIDIKPTEGSCYIRSVCEPFDEEMELDLKKVESWLHHFGLMPYEKIHVSGHVSGEELKNVISEIKPKKVFPVHTENPEMFSKLIPSDAKLVLPEIGKEYSL